MYYKIFSTFFSKLKVNDFFDNLYLLKDDHELLRDGWRIHFAIDFFQLVKYAFPLNDLIEKYKDHKFDEKERFEFAINRATTSMAFEDLTACGPPIILPPYLLELKDTLEFQPDISREKNNIRKVIQGMGETILSPEENENLKSISTWMDHNTDQLPEQYIEPGRNLVLTHYINLLFLLGGYLQEGKKEIIKLFNPDNPKLFTLSTRFPELKEEAEKFYLKDFEKSKWFEILNSLRGSKWRSNYRDAMAIETVYWLNSCLAKKGKKEIVLFISDARAMYDTLNWDKNIDRKSAINSISDKIPGTFRLSNGKVTRLLRNNDTFFLYLILKSKRNDNIETLTNIKNTINLCYNSIKESALRDSVNIDKCPKYLKGMECAQCEQFNTCHIRRKLREIEGDIANYVDRLEIIRLFKEKESYIEHFLDQAHQNSSKIDQTVSRMLRLIKNKKIEEAIDESEAQIKEDLIEVHRDFQEKILDQLSPNLIIKMGYRLDRLNGIPYRVEFRNKEIREIFSKIEKMIYKPGDFDHPQKIEVIDKLFEYSDIEKSKTDESKLLYSILLFCLDSFDFVEQFISRILLEDNLPNKDEYEYLLAIVLEEKALVFKEPQLMKTVIGIMDRLIEKKPDCPKYYHVRGRAIAQAIEDRVLEQMKYRTAVQDFKKGIEIIEKTQHSDIQLFAILHNNLAYSIFLDGDFSKDNLARANDHINKMHGLKEENWSPQFFDTKAVIKYLNALYCIEEHAQKKEELDAAINLINIAIKKFDYLYVRERIKKAVKNHKKILMDARKQIEKNANPIMAFEKDAKGSII